MRPGGAVGPAQTQSERTEHQKLLLLPLLIPGAGSRGVDGRGRGGDGENSGGEREKHKRQEREKEYVGGGGKALPPQRVPRQAAEQACVLLEPEEGTYQNQHNTASYKDNTDVSKKLDIICLVKGHTCPSPRVSPSSGSAAPSGPEAGPSQTEFLVPVQT